MHREDGCSPYPKVRTGDFDRNGTTDIAAITGGAAYVMWGNGHNGFTTTQVRQYPYGNNDVTTADVNQDGSTDIIVTYSSCPVQQNPRTSIGCAGIDIFYGGQGPQKLFYRNAVVNSNFETPYNPYAIDINGDGIADLVAIDGSPAETALYVWLGHADGSFDQNPWVFAVTSDGGNGPMTPGDWNRDGKMDFAMALPGTADTEILLNATNRAGCATSQISRTVVVCQPVDNTYLNSPVRVQATTHDNSPVTTIQEYIDNNLVYNQSGTGLNQTFALGIGWHTLVTKAWDSAGVSFRSDRHVFVYNGTPGATCAAALGAAQICLPAGAHSASPVHILANAYPTWIPTAAQLYIDGTLVINDKGCDASGSCVGSTSFVDTYQNLSSGTHSLVFKLWDANGTAYTASKSVTVP